MSQSAVILPGSPLSGSSMIGDINAAWAAIISKFSGTTAPTLGPGLSGALVEGQWWLDTSTTPHVLRAYDGTSWNPLLTLDSTNHFIQPPQALRNILMDNGGFEIWQRDAGSAASIAVGASTTAYTADRWYVITGANQASVVAATVGLTNASNIAAKVTRNNAQTGVTAYTFGYPLDTDEVVRMRGNKVTISAVLKGGANWSPTSGTITGTLYVGTGAVAKRGGGFVGETSVVAMTANVTPGGAAASASAVSAATVPTNSTQGEFQFTWTPTGTAGADDSITIDDVQIEIGVFASQFERVPFDMILHKCKRHFLKTFPYGTVPAQNAGLAGSLGFTSQITTAGSAFIQWDFPVEMRATPAITTYNPSATNANWRDVTGAGDVLVLVDTNSAKSSKGVFIGSQTTALTAVHNLYIQAAADSGI